jgi:lysozyme
MELSDIQQLLIRDEGMRLKPYVDSVGKLSIGCGRNLDDNGISEAEALMLLDADIDTAITTVKRCCSVYDELSRPRQLVLISMAFNMGQARLNGFVRFLNAIHLSNWDEAAEEMLSSKWAKQTGPRATRLAEMMQHG